MGKANEGRVGGEGENDEGLSGGRNAGWNFEQTAAEVGVKGYEGGYTNQGMEPGTEHAAETRALTK